MVLKRQIGFISAALLGAALCLLALSPGASGQSAAREAVDYSPSGTPYASGELLVTYEPGASSDALGSIQDTSDVEVESEMPDLDTQLIEFPEVEGEIAQDVREEVLAEVKAELASDPAVESVQYNHVRRLSFTPNDPRFGSQYGLRLPDFPAA